MVEEYNAHIRGVDLCYMLLALYRIRLRTCKYYMHMAYYCMGISITNEWLLYQRYCEQKHGSKKDQMDLCQFQSNVANALLLGNKEKDNPKRGRPSSSSSIPNGPFPAKKRYSAAFPIPVEDIRFDRVGHFPVFTKNQNRCRFCPRGYSHIRCRKRNIQLCLVKKRNCFYAFIPNKYNEQSN